MAHAGPDLGAPDPVLKWLPSVKVTTQVLTNILGFAVAWLITHFGLHESAAAANAISALVGVVAGFIAAYLIKEADKFEAEVEAPKA